jgi:predicted permease
MTNEMFESLWKRILFLLRRNRFDRELDEEMRFHLEMKTQENLESGASPEDARYAAQRRFGNITRLKEVSRETWGLGWLESLVRDLRYSARMLRRSPGFALVAVLSLALGIGANTAIFSLINAVLIRTLPVPDPEQLVVLSARQKGRPWYISYPLYRELAARQQVFSGVMATSGEGRKRFTLVDSGEQLENVRTARVSANYFSVLGVHPHIGRTLSAFDEDGQSAPAALISYGFWERQFGRDPGVIGRSLLTTVGYASDAIQRVFTIVGVAPPEFFGETVGESPEVWLPIVHGIPAASLKRITGGFIQVVGRLKPEVSEAQALAAMKVLYQQLLAEEIGAGGQTSVRREHQLTDYTLHFESGSRGLDYLRQRFSRPLQILMLTVGVVLLIACCNIANLLMARASYRQKELGVRLAIGAGRARLVRQLLTESLVISFLGGALGLIVSAYGSALLVSLISDSSGSLILDAEPDTRVLWFTLLVSTMTGFLFGLVPAFRATAVNVMPSLNAVSHSQVAGGRSRRLSRVLIISQIALSILLLVGAGLLLRSLYKLRGIDVGFDRTNVLLVDMEMHPVPSEQRSSLYQRLEERLHQIPGVRSASLSLIGLFAGGQLVNSLSIEGYIPPPGPELGARINIVSPNYFATVGMALLTGRGFTSRDTAASPKVAIVNETFARTFFPAENPLGRRISTKPQFDPGQAIEIVGVVKDSKYNDLRQEVRSMFYLPLFQSTSQFNSVEVRAENPLAVAGPVRQVLREAHPDIEIGRFKTLEDQVNKTLVRERLLSKLCSVFGLLAVFMACVGLYGIMSYVVVRRTREIGLRMALGARRSGVVWLVIREVLVLAGAGIAVGIPLALVSARLIEAFLYGVKPTDSVSIVLATILMLGVAILSGYLPARRASRIDPMSALRYE